MRFLYLEEDDNIRDLYSMKLEADFRAEVVEMTTEMEAIKYLANLEKQNNLESLDLIITVFDALDGGRSDLYSHCKKNKIRTPFVAISTKPLKAMPEVADFLEINPLNRLIKKPVQEKLFKDTLYDIFEKDGDKVKWKKLSDEGHIPVKISNFLRFNKVPCDVFIRLNQKKFVKLIHKDDMYTSDVVEKYIEKNIEELYVIDEDYPNLANVGLRTLLSLYDRSPKDKSNLDLQLASLEEIHKSVTTLGISKETDMLTKKTIESSVKLVKRVPTIAQLLTKMKESGNYIYDHSMKVSFICTAIAKHT